MLGDERSASVVVAVYRGSDTLEVQKPLAPKVLPPDLVEFPRLPMPPSEVHHVGEPVAVVIAENRYLAEDAPELIDVDYEILPAIASTAPALAPDAPMAHSGATSNVAVRLVQRSGSAEKALDEAPHRLS